MNAKIPIRETRRLAVVLGALVEGGARLDMGASGAVLRNAAGAAILKVAPEIMRLLASAGFVAEGATGLGPTEEGVVFLRKVLSEGLGFLAQHAELARAEIETEGGEREEVVIDLTESPLAWLRRRKDKTGAPLIDDAQFAAGERLRRDATRAALLPRVSANWNAVPGRKPRGGEGIATLHDGAIAARERVKLALAAVGPELSGVLLDVCCFLKGLEAIESERGWPPRSARIVLLLALTRLAAHYGIASAARGPERGRFRRWRGEGAKPRVVRETEAG